MMKKLLVNLVTRYFPQPIMRPLVHQWTRGMNRLKYGDPNFPRMITIEVNTHCNRRCVYCPNVIQPTPSRKINPEVVTAFCKRLSEIRWHGPVDFIFFSEPLLCEDLEKIVSMVCESAPNCVPRISTNGDLLHESRLRGLIDAGLMRFYVMQHNPTSEEWRARMWALSRQFPGYLVLNTIDGVADSVGLFTFRDAVKVSKRHQFPKLKDGSPYCTVPYHNMQIDIDGNWLLCCTHFEREHSWGNILTESFMDIWKKPEFKSARELLTSGKAPFETCHKCAGLCWNPLP